MKKYVLCPGFVRSRNDGDRHWISAPELARLYGVPIRECDVWDSRRPETLMGLKAEGRVFLRPRADGNYEMSEE